MLLFPLSPPLGGDGDDADVIDYDNPDEAATEARHSVYQKQSYELVCNLSL